MSAGAGAVYRSFSGWHYLGCGYVIAFTCTLWTLAFRASARATGYAALLHTTWLPFLTTLLWVGLFVPDDSLPIVRYKHAALLCA